MDDTQEQFVRLFSLCQGALSRFISAHVPDAHVAEDVLQEVSARLWQKFDSYERGTSFRAWAFQVAQYELLHARRAHARSRLVLNDVLTERAAKHFQAREFAEIEEQRRALDSCIEQLPPEQRSLLEKRYRADTPCTKIASALGRTVNQVRVQLFRIRSALRKCVAQTTRVAGEGVS